MDERDEPNEYRQTRYEAPQGATDVLLIRHGARHRRIPTGRSRW